MNLIVAHLGAGASVTAIQNGKSIDTTMGLTPLEGWAAWLLPVKYQDRLRFSRKPASSYIFEHSFDRGHLRDDVCFSGTFPISVLRPLVLHVRHAKFHAGW